MPQPDQLVGAWELVSNVNSCAGVESHPFGDDAQGQLMLDPSGCMSVLMFRRGLQPFASGSRTAGTDAENRQVVQGCLAIFGTYEVLEQEGALVLHGTASTYPNLCGKPVRRPFRLEGDHQMVWEVQEATVGGTSRITWRRVRA